jgi:DNA mismatch repair protein MSH6
VTETVDELHRRQYYPKASKQKTNDQSTARWPPVLRAVMEGEANLALSSFGAALYYLQRSLIDAELLSLGIVKAYVPPSSTVVSTAADGQVESLAAEQSLTEAGVLESSPPPTDAQSTSGASMDWSATLSDKTVADVNHMALDGTTLHNLEILYNTADGKVAGSLWSKLNHTKTPHGSRLLRAWLLRPLFRKADIERRADAVEELVAGGAAVALNEARSILAKCGDIERLLSRVHSMSGSTGDEGGSAAGVHPSERAVLYEAATYTKRKVGDFSKVLTGLRQASQIPSVFHGLEINSGLLHKIAMSQEDGGRFPDITAELEWYFDNFDCEKAAKGFFEPNRGVDDLFDEALDAIERIEADLKDYQKEVCASLGPQARSTWKYVNTKPNSKDKYLIELPASVRVPQDFIVKGKRGSGGKQVNKYSTPVVEQLVQELEQALDTQSERKSRGMQLIFAKFDSMRHLWALVAQTTAMLDALGALAIASSKPGYSRPTMIDCPPDGNPSVSVSQGRHPCIETSMNAEFIPNDISLGTGAIPSRVLLLSGPNMGGKFTLRSFDPFPEEILISCTLESPGKSTLLRQTCLISILAQIGCFVPAEDCHLTPIDRIFTRLGASDRILLGQSTFFVEVSKYPTQYQAVVDDGTSLLSSVNHS